MDGDQQLNEADEIVDDDPLAPIPDDEEPDKGRIYWALWKGRDLVDALEEKTRDFYTAARNQGLIDRWVIAYAFHHGATPEDLREIATQVVNFTGSELERVRFHINLTRSYNRHAAIMALGEKPAFKAKTLNSDHRALASAELADKIINGLYSRYYEDRDPEVAEGDGFAGACGTHTRWDFKSGDTVTIQAPVMQPMAAEDGAPLVDENGKPRMEAAYEEQWNPETGEIDRIPLTHPKKVKSGCPYVTTVYPWSVTREVRSSGDDLWYIIREQESKWNIIAQFGEDFRDDILRQNTKLDEFDFATLFRLEQLEIENKDLLTIQHFYHARCAALPEGRYVVLCGDCILWDGPCPTKEGMPYAEMRSCKFVETNFPYCDGWDLISINQALNQCTSDELNNLALFGRQSTYSEKGSLQSFNGLTKGTHYEIPPGAKPPGAVMLAAMPPSDPFKQYLNSMMDRMTAIGGTQRGEPDANVRSGEMAALLDSISIRSQSFRQQAARRFRIRNAQIILDMISRYGETQFLIDVAGVEDRTFALEFTKEDLSGVHSIDIDVASPMMQTASGRYQWFLGLQQIPKEERAAAHEFVMSGDPDAYIGRDRSTDMLIRRENEFLITGARDVEPNAWDNPLLHVPKHVAAIERLQASENPDDAAIERLRMHVLKHSYTFLMDGQPLILQMLGVMPPPPIGPSPDAPFGNAAFRFQMQLQSGMPMPMAPLTESGVPAGEATPPPGQQQPAGGPSEPKPPKPPTEAGPPQGASPGVPQNHPSGTPLPQPSQPPPVPQA